MIKGVSDKVRLPRLGKIRLGIKVQGEKSLYPRAVDYFVCPPEVEKVFGQKPKELRIMLPTEDPEQWASQFYRCYSSTRGLICKGDGEKALAMVNSKTGEIATKDAKETELREVICNPEECAKLQSGACKPVMNLQFLLPEVMGLGIWQLDTSSYNSIRNINSSVRLIKGVLGRISLIPLSLKVEPMEAQVEGKKKNIFVLHLMANYTLADIVAKLQGLPIGQALLPEPDQEAPDDLLPAEVIAEKTGEKSSTTSGNAPEAPRTGVKPPAPTNPIGGTGGGPAPEVLDEAVEAIMHPQQRDADWDELVGKGHEHTPPRIDWIKDILPLALKMGVKGTDLPKALGLKKPDVNLWTETRELALDTIEAYARLQGYAGPKWWQIKIFLV